MDRAEELRVSLPSLLSQDYPDYSVIIVDHSSQDGLPSLLQVIKSPRLCVVRCPRPRHFNRARAGNVGVRYSFSDLLFFLDTGVAFRDERHLSEIVAAFERSSEIDDRHYERWRQESGYPVLDGQRAAADEARRRVYCECECHGLHVLVSRSMFQRIGGLNESLWDWGYEDTDLATRLELCRYGRIPIRDLVEGKHQDEDRVRFHREKSKERSWAKNRLISDGFIRTFGPVIRTQRLPGGCDWVEIDGVRYAGVDAPQQDWTMETVAELLARRVSAHHSPPDDQAAPLVSVVVPTKNAAEYIVVVLDSILSQDYPNIECLVVDGGSTDATLDILASYGDRITWTSQPDRGAFDAINRGWQSSRGQILAWLNADDGWAPGGISAVVRCFHDDPEADVIYGDCLIIDADGQQLEFRRPPDWDLGYAVETCHHMIDQPAAFIRRSMAQRVGWLYPAWFHDWELWRRVSLGGGKIKRVPHLLGCARVRASNSQYRPEILIDGLLGVTKRLFSLPGVPADIQGLKRRALSNCYLKIVQTLQYGRPQSRGLRLKLRINAFVADPTNLPNVLKSRPAGRRPLPMNSREESGVGDAKSTAQASLTIPAIAACAVPVGTRAPRSSENHIGLPEPRVAVSVVVPCKNDARYLPAALESILAQDYPLLECIVVDGGSTDGTIELLKRYGDRIRWLSEPDRGAFDAINRGWRLSKGEILAWLNADDLWEAGAVRTAVDVFERQPDVDVVYGTAGVVDELGRVHGNLVPGAWDLEYALRYCDHVIFQPASFMRRRILEKIGWLYPAWCHDHDLWLRIARAGGRFARLSTRLAMDRMRPDNLGTLAEVVVPAKIALTKRFFADPGLPPTIKRLQPRAISNAYIRAVDYLRIGKPRHWLLATHLLAQAIVVDPGNIRAIGERFTRPFRWRVKRLLPEGFRLFSKIFALATAISGRLVRLVFPLARLKQWLGKVVERVFVRGNRGLTLEIGGLQRRVEAVERAASEALQPVAARIDRDRQTVVETLESLKRQHEELRKEVEAVRLGQLAMLSAAQLEVHGTPPMLHRIPGWHTHWGVDPQLDPLLGSRFELWSSLRSPVLMRWFANLLVMIWPGNELSRVLFLTGNFEPNEMIWMRQTLTKGMTMIDVGAHMGLYSMVASKLVGESGFVLSLEPSAREFQRLALHIMLNDLRNVRCVQVAASDSLGEGRLRIAGEWNSGHNTFGEFFSPAVEMVREEEVRTQTVDALVAAQGLERVDLVKIDVEGHELKVLAGTVETLTRFRPRVLVEVFEETLRRQGASVEAVLALLEDHGYVLHEFSNQSGELVPLLRPVGTESRNVVALPR